MSRTESYLNELLAQQSVIRRIAERSIVVDSLIDYIPAVHLTFVVAYHSLDMLDETSLQHLFGGRTGCIAIGEPPVGSL